MNTKNHQVVDRIKEKGAFKAPFSFGGIMKTINLIPAKNNFSFECTSVPSIHVFLNHIHHEKYNSYSKDDKKRFSVELTEESLTLKCELKEIAYFLTAVEKANQSVLDYEDKKYTLPSVDDKGRFSVSYVVDNKLKRFLVPLVRENGRKIGFAHVYVKSIYFKNENDEFFEVRWYEK